MKPRGIVTARLEQRAERTHFGSKLLGRSQEQVAAVDLLRLPILRAGPRPLLLRLLGEPKFQGRGISRPVPCPGQDRPSCVSWRPSGRTLSIHPNLS